MATDIRELARHLGFERIALIGHDRGARVGLRFARDYPEMLDRLAVLDNIPTKVIFDHHGRDLGAAAVVVSLSAGRATYLRR